MTTNPIAVIRCRKTKTKSSAGIIKGMPVIRNCISITGMAILELLHPRIRELGGDWRLSHGYAYRYEQQDT